MKTDHVSSLPIEQGATAINYPTAAPEAKQIETAPAEHQVPRRSLLAVLGAAVAGGALFRSTGAKAAGNVTVNAGSTANYGVLASPGAAGAPLLPAIGITTHGVIGSNSGATVVPFGSGVCGVRAGNDLAGVLGANGSGGFGVYGITDSGIGMLGVSSTGIGVRGLSTDAEGLSGRSTNGFGVVAVSQTATKAALLARNLAAAPNKSAGLFQGNVRVQGNLSVTGVKAAAVEMADGTLATMYCQESPEPFFEDFGRGRLVNGKARILFEREFAELVRRDDYMVFVQPEGRTHGLFVSKRDAEGFEVEDADAGNTIAFSYRLVARRKDIPGERLARIERLDEIDVAEFDVAPVKKSTASYTGSDDDRVRAG